MSEYISEAEAYKSQLDTSVRALKNVRKQRDEYYEETVCLRTQVKELTEALEPLISLAQSDLGPYSDLHPRISGAKKLLAKVKEQNND